MIDARRDWRDVPLRWRLIGQSADAWGYDPLFVALAALDLVAAVVLWSLLRGTPRTVSRI